LSWLPDIDVAEIGAHLLQLSIAFLLAVPLGFDREQRDGSLGVRTFPLIAMASCGFLLLGESIVMGNPEARSRVLEGAITGVGFLGGGAIVKKGVTVRGTATAAAIWVTAAIGASVAFHRYEIALTLTIAAFAVLRYLGPLKEVASKTEDGRESEARES
jgi:putative Mg2+ transporter-C (MgtC) family protein